MAIHQEILMHDYVLWAAKGDLRNICTFVGEEPCSDFSVQPDVFSVFVGFTVRFMIIIFRS